MRLTKFILLGFLVAALLISSGCNRGSHPFLLNQQAPDFTVADGANHVHLADFRGKPVLLNFWATWCGPCVQEVPSLVQFQRQNPNVVVIAISVDEDEVDYRDFVSRYHMQNLLTVRDPSQHAASLFHTDMWPETYAIDKNGVIRRKFVGAQDWADPAVASFMNGL